ncbi:hypothetical protein EDD21DRAFT_124451 [Dissophora ornata]|nr:hypothetical protein EDD21DRAFT_124451 [Dissophora ornata]
MTKPIEFEGEQLFQLVRAQSVHHTIGIPARFDIGTGSHLVLWKDIQLAFEDAKYLMQGSNMVPFLIDDGLRHLDPKRIKYDPGVVLDIVSKDVPFDTPPRSPIQEVIAAHNDTSSSPGVVFNAISKSSIQDIVVAGQDTSSSPGIIFSPDTVCGVALLTQEANSWSSTTSVLNDLHESLNGISELTDVVSRPSSAAATSSGTAQGLSGGGSRSPIKTSGSSQLISNASFYMTEGSNMDVRPSDVVSVSSGTPHESLSAVHELPDTVSENNGQSTKVTAAVALQLQEMLANLSSATTNTTEESLVIHTTGSSKPDDTNQSLQQYNQLFSSYIAASASGHPIQASNIRNIMMERFGSMESDMLLDKTIQILLLDTQNQILNQLAVVQKRVQAAITQSRELHEYPIPRRFIVLPKQKHHIGKLVSLFAMKFQLFFLCECGAHTMTVGSVIPHEIHLAKHEGYDIDQPDKFFERYGNYVLTVMKILKFGVAATSVAAPALAHLKLCEGIDAIEKYISKVKSGVEFVVDGAVNYGENLLNNAKEGVSPGPGKFDLEKSDVLEGADLRQLETFLTSRDKGRVLGNLYRITVEGHVKWVCIDHYREDYRPSKMQLFKDIVEASNGRLYEDLAEAFVNLSTSTLGKQFCKALTKARRIRKLQINLSWKVTKEDLRLLAAVISKANITSLHVSGRLIKEPTLDVIHKGSRYNPLLELLSEGQILSLELHDFKNFFQHISSSSIRMSPQLQTLKINSITPAVHLTRIIRQCPALIKVEALVEDVNTDFEDLISQAAASPDLKNMTLWDNYSLVNVEFSLGKVEVVDMLLASNCDSLVLAGYTLLRKGYLTKLSTTNLMEIHELPLEELLQSNPRLWEIEGTCHPDRLGFSVEEVASVGKSLYLESNPHRTSTLVFRIKSWSREYMRGQQHYITMCVGFTDGAPVPIISGDIEMRMKYYIRNEGPLPVLFRQYGCYFNKLITSDLFTDDLATQLDESTKNKGSKITKLTLDPWLLTTIGMHCMDRVIERSLDLERLYLSITNLHHEREMEKLKRLLARYGKRLSALKIGGDSPDQWITGIATSIPTRDHLPVLEEFELEGDNVCKISAGISWMVSMISTPPRPPCISLPSSLLWLNKVNTPSTSPSEHTWEPLRRIVFMRIQLQPEDWVTLIKAFDFTTLQELDIRNTNFSIEQYKVLADHMLDNESELPLLLLIVSPEPDDDESYPQLKARIRWKASKAKIY